MATLVTSAFDKAAYSAYEFVRAERDALKEAESVHKRRIEALEKETKDLLKSYQDIYKENKILRSKLEHGPDANRIRRFRADIQRNEERNKQLQTERDLLTQEVHALQRDKQLFNEDTKKVNAAFDTERGLHVERAKILEKETKESQRKIEELEKEKEEYEFRLKRNDREASTIINQVKEAKREKMKAENKFKKQLKLAEDEVEAKNSEIRALKTDVMVYKEQVAKVNSENTTANYEIETLKKRFDFVHKDLDVYKHHAEKMKKDVNDKRKRYSALEGELRVVEGMLTDAREDGFEAVHEERLNWKRTNRKLKEKIEQLEENIEELSRANKEQEDQNLELRAKYESVSTEKQNFYYTESAYKRQILRLEEDLHAIQASDPTKVLLRNNNRGVVVTMSENRVRNLEKEKSALVSRIKYLEKENRRSERRIRELEKGGGGLQDYEENWTMVYRAKSGSRRYAKRRGSQITTRSVDDAFRDTLTPLTLPQITH